MQNYCCGPRAVWADIVRKEDVSIFVIDECIMCNMPLESKLSDMILIKTMRSKVEESVGFDQFEG
jgi:hypothetical protein